MCLAIYKPAGITIPKLNLQAGYYSNRSGCGYAYRENGKLIVVKDLFTFEEFYEKYKEVEKAKDMMVHFRAATHGPINQANCHPFTMCDGQYAMIHNGMFYVPLVDKKLSDTGNFCKLIFESAIIDGSYKDVQKFPQHRKWGWGMVVLMSADGELIIYKEELGHWHKGAWFSNTCHQWGDSGYFKSFLDYREEEQRRSIKNL